MFEIDDPMRRARVLARLGGIEDQPSSRSPASASRHGRPDAQNTSPEGKASSVQFVRFRLHGRRRSRVQSAGSPRAGRVRPPELRPHGDHAGAGARRARRRISLRDLGLRLGSSFAGRNLSAALSSQPLRQSPRTSIGQPRALALAPACTMTRHHLPLHSSSRATSPRSAAAD